MKLINRYKFLSIVTLVFALSSCDALLDENPVGDKFNDKAIWSNPILAEGVLLKAYTAMPGDYDLNESYATDDAVTNLSSSSMISVATGGYTSRLGTALNVYDASYSAMMQVNSFIENMDKVQWAWRNDQVGFDSAHVRNAMFAKKLKGEAYGLRAYFGARLLRHHGGMGANDILLGYPIVNKVYNNIEVAKLPRNTYAECVQQIFSDCDVAIANLPLKWSDKNPNGTDLTATQKLIIGAKNVNRISGIGAMAIKSRVALTAASPAFAAGSGVTMAQAAQMAADIMKVHIGITGLQAKDVEFYKQGNVLAADLNTYREALWFTSIKANDSGREENFFPPSVYGKGLVNPSQNLIEAFGFSNGSPYDENSVSFDPFDPTLNRDPRLKKYIVTHNSKIGTATIDMTAETNAFGPSYTRTGYFMRKLLDETVSIVPGLKFVGKAHSTFHFRYTEVLLNFAEAANEAGPDVAVDGFTARDVIKAIRTRAGLPNTYVDGLDKAGLANLIKNERRIELCFEGSRFWDLRRWNDMAKMNETVRGFNVTTLDSNIPVEERKFEPYMIYPPIPYSEILVYNIIQNKGW